MVQLVRSRYRWALSERWRSNAGTPAPSAVRVRRIVEATPTAPGDLGRHTRRECVVHDVAGRPGGRFAVPGDPQPVSSGCRQGCGDQPTIPGSAVGGWLPGCQRGGGNPPARGQPSRRRVCRRGSERRASPPRRRASPKRMPTGPLLLRERHTTLWAGRRRRHTSRTAAPASCSWACLGSEGPQRAVDLAQYLEDAAGALDRQLRDATMLAGVADSDGRCRTGTQSGACGSRCSTSGLAGEHAGGARRRHRCPQRSRRTATRHGDRVSRPAEHVRGHPAGAPRRSCRGGRRQGS
jgi:hypothetical protein